MDLNIRGQAVIRVCFDMAFTILTSEDCELRVETDASFHTSGGELVSFDPESPESAAAHLVSLVSDVITSAEVGSAGELFIVFGSGAELTVASDPDYEAWGFVGAGQRVTCMPGGEVATWS
ncbi:DUF6188 family protein [Streptomyces sp. NPDC021212]|uniref:DUF6188 family protein n=1 Tax=Streptomyces sp. NPDC021212 TaxID=3365118 RepID=UPI00379AF3FE